MLVAQSIRRGLSGRRNQSSTGSKVIPPDRRFADCLSVCFRLVSIILVIAGLCLLPARAEPPQIKTDADAKALVESDYFLNSAFPDRVKILDEALAGISEEQSPVIWARLTEQKIYAMTSLGNYAAASAFLEEIEGRFFDIAEGQDFYLSALASSAFIYSYAGNVEKALAYTERAQKSEAYKTDPEQQFRLTTPLASIYVNVGYAELGAELLIEFYEANKNVEVNPRLKFGLVSNISYALNQAGQYQKSLEYLNIVSQMITSYEAAGELPEVYLKQMRWHYLSNVAHNRIYLDQFEDLSDIASELESLSDELGSPLLQLRSRYVRAAALYGDGNYTEAADLLVTLINHAEEINSVDLIVDYRKLEVMVLKKLGQSTKALASLEALVEATARLDSQQGRSRLQYLNAQLSLQQKNFEIAELKSSQASSNEIRNRDRITLAVVCGAALILLVLAISLYFTLRKSRVLAAELVVREQEAIRAADVKSQFLANMGHEIRTPLNALLGMTQVLRRKPLDPEVQNSISIMSEFGQMLLAIVNDVLDLSKMDAGKMRIAVSRTSVQSLLKELSNAWEPKIQEKGLTLEIASPGAIPAVLIDPMRVRQCLNNLVSNAVKFTDDGKVSVRTYYDDAVQTLTFEVEDTGVGIPPEHIDKLFEAFEQEDDSTVRRFGGTGLGLSIVRTLTELMGGAVRLDSEPGKGTTAILTLSAPMADDAPEAQTLTAPDGVLEDTSTRALDGPMKFLVVDDHLVNRMIISAFLASDDTEIVEANSASAALEILEADPQFDCILLDNRMPVMDGADLINIIRSSEAGYKDIKIIFITADAMEGDKEKYLNLGADGYVSKPIIREDLINEILRLLK